MIFIMVQHIGLQYMVINIVLVRHKDHKVSKV